MDLIVKEKSDENLENVEYQSKDAERNYGDCGNCADGDSTQENRDFETVNFENSVYEKDLTGEDNERGGSLFSTPEEKTSAPADKPFNAFPDVYENGRRITPIDKAMERAFPDGTLFGKDSTDRASVIFGQSEDEMRREFKAFKAAKLFKKFDCDLTDVFSPEVLDQKLIEAKNYGFGGVVVTPQKIRVAKEKLKGSGVEVVAAVCFPLGEEAFGVKRYAVKKAVEKGADRIYLPVGISTVKFGATDLMKREFKKVIKAAKKKKVSAVIESGMLTSAEIERTVRMLNGAGVMSFVSSTGVFGAGEGVSAVKNIRYYLRSGSEVCGFTASRRSDEAVGLMSVADKLFVKNAAELAADIKSNLKY